MKRDIYIAKIKRMLRLDPKTKKRVIEGIQIEIQLSLDSGLSIDEAIDKLGQPKEIANEYNRSYYNDPEYLAKMKPYILFRISAITAIAAVVLFAASQAGRYIFLRSSYVSSVGGVSGPDNIIETTRMISPLFYLDITGKIALILLTVFVLFFAGGLLLSVKRK